MNRKKIFIRVFILIGISMSLELLLGCEEAENNELGEFMRAYGDNCSYPFSGTVLVGRDNEILWFFLI